MFAGIQNNCADLYPFQCCQPAINPFFMNTVSCEFVEFYVKEKECSILFVFILAWYTETTLCGLRRTESVTFQEKYWYRTAFTSCKSGCIKKKKCNLPSD